MFALVREKMRAKLVLIGDGPDRGAAEYLVRKKKLGRDVHFLGKQDRVYQLFLQADLFLLPSDMESFGLAALEAMACEVPVVATNVGGLAGSGRARSRRLSFYAARSGHWRKIRAGNFVASGSRPGHGTNRARQRQEKILRQ